MNICEYGCGEEAKYQLKNKKWCCSKSWNSCKSKKEKSRISNIGKKRSIEFSKKISLLKKGFKHTEDSLNKIKGPKRKIEKLKIKYPIFSKTEEMRYNPDNQTEIQVHCKNINCKNSKQNNGWNTPTGRQIELRIYEVEKGNKKGFFYCSKNCKFEDPDFHKHVDLNTKKEAMKGIIRFFNITPLEVLIEIYFSLSFNIISQYF